MNVLQIPIWSGCLPHILLESGSLYVITNYRGVIVPFCDRCWENQHFRDRWQSLLSVDDIVTDLFATLEDLGIAKKTFVVYSSDHGCVPAV